MSVGEIKCSAKQQTSVYVRTAKAMMDESRQDGRQTFAEVALSGLGPAVGTVIAAAARLEKDGYIIKNVATDLPEMTGDDHVTRHVPQLRVVVKRA